MVNGGGAVRKSGRTADGGLGMAVERAQSGDEEAFEAVYRQIHPRLLGYVRGLVGDDAEDVAAEAWLEIARDLLRFRGDGDGFRGWTATIARHRALDHLRRQRSRPRVTEFEHDLLDLPGGQDTEREAFESLSTERALALVRKLPRDQAEAVLLRVVVGLDGPAAARVLGKRVGAVRTASYRGLKRLAPALAALSPAGAAPASASVAASGKSPSSAPATLQDVG